MTALEPVRSLLFVPGNREDRIDKALQSQADGVIIDLEDAVPLKLKDEARKIVKDKIQKNSDKKVFVRVNALDTEYIARDIEEIVVKGLGCIMVPKLEKPEDMHVIDAYLTQAEKEKGIEQGTIKIMPLIETALAVQNIFRIVTETSDHQRLFTVAFGAADFTLDMGIEMTFTAEEQIYPRSRIAVACCAAKISPPIDSPFMLDIKNIEALEADARRSRQLGFQGKLCIHPTQLEVCNTVYAPSENEVHFAQRVVDAFEEAENKGWAAIQVDGKFIDYPIVYRAKKIMRLAESIAQT
ncbi:HpcH/HpaI aldolase/citrate lyase family protein [Desulfovermiculus halophilus]|jgi:citrate lyase subunit beta/citryl-CoA lyase|uniref:HpcH/HpaI aldolase/citrate lyase family protein n=1 Tax=Desulfovermiculus halophilus TaxID=339722 RepID=UPI000488D1DD|nr:CoA ester lyase [Desulfovermiculus halophilus]